MLVVSDESTRRARLERLLSEDPRAARERALSEADRRTQGRPLVLHGCGQLGRKLARALADDGRAPVGFSDNDPAKAGTTVDGIEVLSTHDAVERWGESAAFVVSKWSPGDGYLDVERQLAQMGARCIVALPVFMWRYPEQMLPHFLFALPDTLLACADEIVEAYGLLGEEESHDQFLGQLEWRLWADYRTLPMPRPLALQYFEPGIVRLGAGERFVDCGAFDGDTLRSFLSETGGAFEHAFAFEPDPGTFERLANYVGQLPDDVRARITLTDAAVGDEECTLHFDGGGGTSAKVTDAGDIEVSCVRLDDVVDRASYIKLDIEGAETGAILGARRLLSDAAVQMAVSLYHTPTDFFRLVTLTHSLMPDAILRCRGYEVDGLEFVLYATVE